MPSFFSMHARLRQMSRGVACYTGSINRDATYKGIIFLKSNHWREIIREIENEP